MMKVALISGDDWSGLYINGYLLKENNTLGLNDVLRLLSKECNFEFEEKVPDQEWLDFVSHLPINLNDVKI